MTVFTIETIHEVLVTYRVTAESFREALETLCNKELFTEYCGEPATFGPDGHVLEENDIEVVEAECYGDPSPAGRQHVERAWDYTEEGGE